MGLYCTEEHNTNPFYKRTPANKEKYNARIHEPALHAVLLQLRRRSSPSRVPQRKTREEAEEPDREPQKQDPQASTATQFQALEEAARVDAAEPPRRRVKNDERPSALPSRRRQGKRATRSAITELGTSKSEAKAVGFLTEEESPAEKIPSERKSKGNH